MTDWIRQRPLLVITATTWHAVSGITPAGIRVAACGEIFGPEDPLEDCPDAVQPPAPDRCQRCHEANAHLVTTASAG